MAIWTRTASLHWSERARRLYPIQVSAVWGLLATGVAASIMAGWVWGNSWATSLIFCLASFVGGLAGNYLPNRWCVPTLTIRQYFGTCLKTWVFFLGLIASTPLLSWAMGTEWNLRSAGAAVLYLGAYLWFVSTGWVWLMRRFKALGAAPSEWVALVQEQALARNIKVNNVLVLEDYRAIAFALPLQGAVGLTRKVVNLLTPDELRSIVDHELGHLGEPRGVLVGRVVASLTFAPLPFMGIAARWHGITGIAVCYLSMLVIGFVSRRLSRAMELRADRFAVGDHPSETGAVYARALEKIYAANLIPASGLGRGQTHPDLYDRMLSAGLQPDFPRPKKPGYVNWTVLIWILLVFGMLILRTWVTGEAP